MVDRLPTYDLDGMFATRSFGELVTVEPAKSTVVRIGALEDLGLGPSGTQQRRPPRNPNIERERQRTREAIARGDAEIVRAPATPTVAVSTTPPQSTAVSQPSTPETPASSNDTKEAPSSETTTEKQEKTSNTTWIIALAGAALLVWMLTKR